MAKSAAANQRGQNGSQAEYRQTIMFLLFFLVVLCMVTATFLNPLFMKKKIQTESNQAVIVRKVDSNFNTLATEIGANDADEANLLTVKQTQPIAEHIIDYTLGLHWFRTSDDVLAKQILHDINLNIDQNASSDAQRVRKKLQEQKTNAPYAVSVAFNLKTVTIGANIALALLVVNVVLLIFIVLSLISIIKEMKSKLPGKVLLHSVTAAGMWVGFWLILIFVLLSLIPVVFDVEKVLRSGYLFELGSSVFLDFVIAGAILYVVMAIPWQLTSND